MGVREVKHTKQISQRILQPSFSISKGIEDLEMPEVTEAEDESEPEMAKIVAISPSSTTSGEETLKEEEDTIAKSPKIGRRLPVQPVQVPQFRGQQVQNR